MNDTNVTEKRRFARLDLALTVSYAVIDPSGHAVDPREALSSDISAGGVRLMTPTPLEVGAMIDLNIHLADQEDNPVRAKGEVVWQTKISSTSFETGVVIKEMPDADKKRFMSFVFDQLSKVVTG